MLRIFPFSRLSFFLPLIIVFLSAIAAQAMTIPERMSRLSGLFREPISEVPEGAFRHGISFISWSHGFADVNIHDWVHIRPHGEGWIAYGIPNQGPAAWIVQPKGELGLEFQPVDNGIRWSIEPLTAGGFCVISQYGNHDPSRKCYPDQVVLAPLPPQFLELNRNLSGTWRSPSGLELNFSRTHSEGNLIYGQLRFHSIRENPAFSRFISREGQPFSSALFVNAQEQEKNEAYNPFNVSETQRMMIEQNLNTDYARISVGINGQGNIFGACDFMESADSTIFLYLLGAHSIPGSLSRSMGGLRTYHPHISGPVTEISSHKIDFSGENHSRLKIEFLADTGKLRVTITPQLLENAITRAYSVEFTRYNHQ